MGDALCSRGIEVLLSLPQCRNSPTHPPGYSSSAGTDKSKKQLGMDGCIWIFMIQ